ncbi:MAG: site-specific integrase [Sphingobium sp.]|jgi:site-specific recombinase XerD|uniref:tyrosine-type recombinase/integrase n=1 Tax=Novosphingobium percolationis TaxID=2871811 RepID=UPI001CD4E3B3|nr:tyrosine-type recombinase/integrase [Novosphingobium percolationis]MCI1756687.1 site-specific integrase [Sphingobium sp.]MCI1757109.1 site-specific integrase [Sphingobium sp.]MCI1757470.1 site-specific integrase [Sphingobium sp.]
MAQLLFSTPAFRPDGSSVENVPMLLDARMRLVEPACAWLMHVALVRGRTRSPQTWRTYGEALYDWWQTLEANGWVWNEVGPGELSAYRDQMLRPRSGTGRPLARSTINGRLRTIGRFYRWSVATGLMKQVPFVSQEITMSRSRPQGYLAHIDATGGRTKANELTMRHVPMLPRPLAPEAIRRIMAAMSVRDRLIVEWAVTTGIRRMEVAGLTVRHLKRSGNEPMIPVQIDETKGGRSRMIYPPAPLVDRTRAYVREERAVLIRRTAVNRAGCDPDALFLTCRGQPVKPRRVGAMFAAAAEAAGVNATFHALRHTFAAAMLRFLQREAQNNPELNPLLTLQVLLGHADLATTAVYLRVVETDLSVIEASVDDLYAALL